MKNLYYNICYQPVRSTNIVLTYKGKTEMDAGMYFCPYVPLSIKDIPEYPGKEEPKKYKPIDLATLRGLP